MYTYGSGEALAATCDALPHKYPMELNRTDMRTLLYALHTAYNEGDEDAGALLADIQATLDIEVV